MADKDIYKKLAGHFKFMGMPIPTSEEFTETLRLNLTPVEAEVLSLLPRAAEALGPAESRGPPGLCRN